MRQQIRLGSGGWFLCWFCLGSLHAAAVLWWQHSVIGWSEIASLVLVLAVSWATYLQKASLGFAW